MRGLFVAIAMLSLAGCGGDGQSRGGDVSVGEAEALDNAAEMVEQQRLPADALRPPAPRQQQESQPEAE